MLDTPQTPPANMHLDYHPRQHLPLRKPVKTAARLPYLPGRACRGQPNISTTVAVIQKNLMPKYIN